jgi:transposase
MEQLYGGIDLHGNNNVIALLDEQDRVRYQRRLSNDLPRILEELAPYQSAIVGLAVESTFNWYWLVDGLMEEGYRVHLANPAAMQQYTGLKYTDDDYDARWLGRMLRLGLLPEGYIYPKEARRVRDLLRKRAQMVRYRTSNLLSVENLYNRNTGQKLSGNQVKGLSLEDAGSLFSATDLNLAVKCNVAVMSCVEEQIGILERAVKERTKLRPEYRKLLTTPGIGPILGMTIMLETGDIKRFPRVGDFASYCRCVGSERLSNGKKKGKGNTKNGNKYLGWAFVEAANFAVRFSPRIQQYYQRKQAKTKGVVAIKAVAHKLARACYYVMRDQVAFNVTRAFSG